MNIQAFGKYKKSKLRTASNNVIKLIKRQKKQSGDAIQNTFKYTI